jgi:DNA-binding NtrC family response regulator
VASAVAKLERDAIETAVLAYPDDLLGASQALRVSRQRLTAMLKRLGLSMSGLPAPAASEHTAP